MIGQVSSKEGMWTAFAWVKVQRYGLVSLAPALASTSATVMSPPAGPFNDAVEIELHRTLRINFMMARS
jgi:hypothetical protein